MTERHDRDTATKSDRFVFDGQEAWYHRKDEMIGVPDRGIEAPGCVSDDRSHLVLLQPDPDGKGSKIRMLHTEKGLLWKIRVEPEASIIRLRASNRGHALLGGRTGDRYFFSLQSGEGKTLMRGKLKNPLRDLGFDKAAGLAWASTAPDDAHLTDKDVLFVLSLKPMKKLFGLPFIIEREGGDLTLEHDITSVERKGDHIRIRDSEGRSLDVREDGTLV